MKRLCTLLPVVMLAACATYHDVKEIRTLSFDENVEKGKSKGQFEADDCVFHVLGYRLGGNPDISKAVANARTLKKTGITDVIEDQNDGSGEIRYVNDLTVERGGFDAYVFGKDCIIVKGVAYR